MVQAKKSEKTKFSSSSLDCHTHINHLDVTNYPQITSQPTVPKPQPAQFSPSLLSSFVFLQNWKKKPPFLFVPMFLLSNLFKTFSGHNVVFWSKFFLKKAFSDFVNNLTSFDSCMLGAPQPTLPCHLLSSVVSLTRLLLDLDAPFLKASKTATESEQRTVFFGFASSAHHKAKITDRSSVAGSTTHTLNTLRFHLFFNPLIHW